MLNAALKELDLLKSGKLKSRLVTGKGIASDLGNIAAEATFTHAIPWLGKKAIEMGRYYGSEALRDPKLQ